MKPLKTELQDAETLRELGIASVQVVHDLKNQLNGLKLYATFLRKRMEKAERPADEPETIAQLIAGLERGARVETDGGDHVGEFDPALLAEALKNITTGGRASAQGGEEGGAEVRLTRQESGASAAVEWRGVPLPETDGDPFRSFNGGAGLRLALAARVIREHGGEVV